MSINITNIHKPKLIIILNMRPKCHFLIDCRLSQKFKFASEHPVFTTFVTAKKMIQPQIRKSVYFYDKKHPLLFYCSLNFPAKNSSYICYICETVNSRSKLHSLFASKCITRLCCCIVTIWICPPLFNFILLKSTTEGIKSKAWIIFHWGPFLDTI